VKKEMLEYLRGERNAVRDEFILSREKSRGSELVHVSHPELEESLYDLWSPAKHKKRHPLVNEQSAKAQDEVAQPKNTGGKRPYIMLMEDNSGIDDGLSLEASGLLYKIFRGGHVEWHTGKVIHKRDKKAMTFNLMSKQFKIGKKKLRRLLAELTSKKVVKYDTGKRAYFTDRKLAKKGGGQHENKI